MYCEYKEELEKLSLDEQALARKDAVSKCIDLGSEFIEHFEKIYEDRKGIDSIDFYHHCSEMAGWWKKARKLKLTSNNKPLSDSKLVDWFLQQVAMLKYCLKMKRNELFIVS